MFSYSFTVVNRGNRDNAITIQSSVDDVHHLPNSLHDVYTTFPLFFQQLQTLDEHPQAQCRVQQTLWWNGDTSFRLSSTVSGTFRELVLSAAVRQRGASPRARSDPGSS